MFMKCKNLLSKTLKGDRNNIFLYTLHFKHNVIYSGFTVEIVLCDGTKKIIKKHFNTLI